MDDPTLNTWNEIAEIWITPKHRLWTAVALLKPAYINQFQHNRWVTFPDAIALGNAIKAVIIRYNKIKTNCDDFNPPLFAA